jgi:hypothetical protein
MFATNRSRLMVVLSFALGACAVDGSFLFAEPIEGVPGVLDLKGPDGTAVTPFSLDPASPGLRASQAPFPATGITLPDGNPPVVLVLNEALLDGTEEDLSCDGDTDPDANRFVEIVNSGTATAQLGGYTVSVAGDVFHTFDPGTSLPPNEAIVVFSSITGSSSCVPAGATFVAANGATDFEVVGRFGADAILRDDTNAVVSDLFFDDSSDRPQGTSVNRVLDGQFDAAALRHDRIPSAIRELIPEQIIYAEIGPNENSLPSGATLEFVGTGGDVCVFVDPELVWWNTSVSQSSPEQRYRFPDNPFDDGDLDVRIGQSVYYRGTPGVSMGGFEVQYTDALGIDVEVNLVACQNVATEEENLEPFAGRGSPEYCTVRNTQPGVNYTVAMEAFSLPRDDARLAFGIILSAGDCADTEGSLVRSVSPPAVGVTKANEECVIRGEALPAGDEAALFYGYEPGRTLPGAEDFEDAHCNGLSFNYCVEEIQSKRAAGILCDYEGISGDPERRCFCGDRGDNPSPGARR